MNNDDKELFAALGKDLDEAIVLINKKVINQKLNANDYSKNLYRYLKEVGLRKPKCWVTFEIPKHPSYYLLYGNSRINLDYVGKHNISKFVAKKLKELRDIESKVCRAHGTIGSDDPIKKVNSIKYNGVNWTLGSEKGQMDWIKFLFACDAKCGLLVADILPHAEKLKCYSSGDILDTFKGMYEGESSVHVNEIEVELNDTKLPKSADPSAYLSELADYISKTIDNFTKKNRK